MAYLFLGTKAKEASEQNDIIRIFNKKAAAEMNVDEKYSYQLYITFGLWQEEQTLEGIAADELAELQRIKADIVRLYEEIYGKHVEKHKIIEEYLAKVDEAVEHIRKMCQDIDKDLLDKVEDLSEIFQRRINEIRAKLDAIIAKYVDPATLKIEQDIEALLEYVSKFTNYSEAQYQTYIDKMFTKFDEYLASNENEEELRKDAFDKSVEKLIRFDAFGPFTLENEDVELYNSCTGELEALVQDIKEQAAQIKQFTFKKVGDKNYQYNQQDDYEHEGETHDLDGDGQVYEYGEDAPKPVDEIYNQATQVLGQDTVDDING